MKKVGIFFTTILLSGGGLFTSCENFLNGAELKAKIENQVAYANAPSYTIHVDYPENSGIIKSPAGGEVTKKVSDVFTVDFEPASDWEFIRWKIVDSVTDNEIPDGEYLSLSTLSAAKTECTFKKLPPDGINLCLAPEVAERPQILSYTPLYVADGTRKDSSIQVIFDYDMDPESIYYTENEVASLLESGILSSNLLYSEVNGETKCYGYKIRLGNRKNGYYYEYYFKNIAITDNETGKNLNEHFNGPAFENPRILTITTKKDNELPPWSQLLVKLEKKFSYKVGEKPVMMNSAKKWIYMVTDEIDTNPPLAPGENDVKIFLSNETTMLPRLSTIPSKPWNTSSSKIPYCNDKKLHFKLEMKDRESGPARGFKVCVQKIATYEGSEGYKVKESSAVKTKSFDYQNVSGQTAICDKTMDISDLIDGDGVYRFYFVFSDRSDRSISYPSNGSQYYFMIDTTAPHVYYRMETESYSGEASTAGNEEVTINWKGSNQWYNYAWVSADCKTTIKYKKHSESTYSHTVTTDAGVTYKTITGLEGGVEYDFMIIHEDFNGHTTEPHYWSATVSKAVPNPPRNVREKSFTSGTTPKITVEWDEPIGDYDYCSVYFSWFANKKNGKPGFESKTVTVPKGTTQCTQELTNFIPDSGFSIEVQIYAAKYDVFEVSEVVVKNFDH